MRSFAPNPLERRQKCFVMQLKPNQAVWVLNCCLFVDAVLLLLLFTGLYLYVKDALTFAVAVHLVHLSVRFTDGPQLRLPEYTLTTHTQTGPVKH